MKTIAINSPVVKQIMEKLDQSIAFATESELFYGPKFPTPTFLVNIRPIRPVVAVPPLRGISTAFTVEIRQVNRLEKFTTLAFLGLLMSFHVSPYFLQTLSMRQRSNENGLYSECAALSFDRVVKGLI